jgi:hypothetical protein
MALAHALELGPKMTYDASTYLLLHRDLLQSGPIDPAASIIERRQRPDTAVSSLDPCRAPILQQLPTRTDHIRIFGRIDHLNEAWMIGRRGRRRGGAF